MMEEKKVATVDPSPQTRPTINVKLMEKNITNKVLKKIAMYFFSYLLLMKVGQIIFAFSGTYLDENEVTARLGYKLMRRTNQLALEMYPGYREVRDKIEKIEKRLTTFSIHLAWENDTFRKDDGFLAEFVSKSAREEWMDGNFEGHIAEEGRTGLANDIAAVQRECQELWDRYYLEEYDLNRQYLDNKWWIEITKLLYYVYLHEIASREFENGLKKLNDAMEKRHWDLLWDIYDVATTPTKEEHDKGIQYIRRYERDGQNVSESFKWDFAQRYKRILQIKCYFKRKEAWPYSSIPQQYWGVNEVVKSGPGQIGYGSFWKLCLKRLFN